MPLDAEGYFHLVRSALDRAPYVINGVSGTVKLVETIDTRSGKQKIELPLNYTGELFVIKLDCKNKNGNQEPLFHFFDDNSKPWAKCCDFVIFHLINRRINVRLMEFKWESLPVESIRSQLSASFAWLRTVQSAIKHYMGHERRLEVTKFVCSNCHGFGEYVDSDGKYLRGDSGVRHYLYDQIRNTDISRLENRHVDMTA